MALLVFAVCLVAGLAAGNTLSTILAHALEAMAATLVVGAGVGLMAQKMLDENVDALKAKDKGAAGAAAEKNSGPKEAKPPGAGR